MAASSRWFSIRTILSVVDSLSILIDADAAGYNVIDAIHQPDNIETTQHSLLIQEDPGSHNQYPAGGPGTNAADLEIRSANWSTERRGHRRSVLAAGG